MKKLTAAMLILLFSISLLASCSDGKTESSASPEETSEESIMTPDSNAQTVWNEKYSYGGISGADKVSHLTAFSDGKETDDYADASGDTRYIFEGDSETRIAVLSEGYALTLPDTGVTADFSLGALRSKYTTDRYILTVSYEDQNPYGDNENGFKIYYDEWLARYFENVDFLNANGIRRTRPIGETTELLPGYTVNYYDMTVTLASRMQYDTYSVAIVRPTNSYDHFWFFVMKSEKDMYEAMDAIVASFVELDPQGTPVNSVGAYELKIPESWNSETLAYYNSIMSQTDVDFGAYFAGNDTSYIDWMYSDEALGAPLDVFMTYLHIGWYDTASSLDLSLVNAQAGGNGVNGKPVLELTYQFTNTNNSLGGYTPMYDICREKYDTQFRKLAKDIKSYGKPVLFRLNNEMNTDWTSYCGMVTMCDPDIFIETWRYLYDLFQEEGVDNCIWIFNPIATSCPYSNWGDTLNYFPGEDYVQMLGLTYYQMNTDDDIASFETMYRELYRQNTPYFDNYPAIIGEFGCAAGGDYYYDWGEGAYIAVTDTDARRDAQEKWIDEMFSCFSKNQEKGYEFCKNIKIATWFSANDYATIDGKEEIINHLKLDESTPKAIAALRRGIEAMRAKNQ